MISFFEKNRSLIKNSFKRKDRSNYYKAKLKN